MYMIQPGANTNLQHETDCNCCGVGGKALIMITK